MHRHEFHQRSRKAQIVGVMEDGHLSGDHFEIREQGGGRQIEMDKASGVFGTGRAKAATTSAGVSPSAAVSDGGTERTVGCLQSGQSTVVPSSSAGNSRCRPQCWQAHLARVGASMSQRGGAAFRRTASASSRGRQMKSCVPGAAWMKTKRFRIVT